VRCADSIDAVARKLRWRSEMDVDNLKAEI
jgi:hypothetical protein